MSREKSTKQLMLDLEEQATNIMAEFSDFTDGTRVLLLLQRSKDGGHNKEHRRRRARFVVHNKEQYIRSLLELLLFKAILPIEYRIYASASPRSIRNAEIEFKRTMLEVDFTGGENKEFFYQHIEDKWISALMSSNPLKGSDLFILDIDKFDNGDALMWLSNNKIELVKQYRTKQGWHMVVRPFNRTLFPKEIGEVKDDGLLLLAH